MDLSFDWIAQPDAWIALFTLTMLEIVLGIDNLIFLSLAVAKLPESKRERARKIGLILAMVMRLGLLIAISWVMSLTANIFTVLEHGISGRDIILILGGCFLILSSSHEIFKMIEGHEDKNNLKGAASFGMVMMQIMALDVIFSLDSVITAVGMVEHVTVMMIAVVISIGVMLLSAKSIGDFVDNHPSIKMLALAFLILVGVVLFADGFDYHMPKTLIYVPMAFALAITLLNMKRKKNITDQGKCSACDRPLGRHNPQRATQS
jgi:predicted tellurium resistance membrane protein TerC